MERAQQERTSPVNVQPSQTLTGLPTEYGMSENPAGRDPPVFPRVSQAQRIEATDRGRESEETSPSPIAPRAYDLPQDQKRRFFWPQYSHIVQHISVWIRWIACQGDQWYPEL